MSDFAHSPLHSCIMASWVKTNPNVLQILPKLCDLEKKIQGVVKRSEEKKEAVFSMVEPFMNEDQIRYAKLPWSRESVHFDEVTTALLDIFYSSESIHNYMAGGVEYALYLINKEPYELQYEDDEDKNSDTFYVSLEDWENNLSNAANMMVESTLDHIRDISWYHCPEIIEKLEELIHESPEQQVDLAFAKELGQATSNYHEWVGESLEEISDELSQIVEELESSEKDK